MLPIDQILTDQDGVISRRQALTAGLTPTQVARRLRRREWATVHTGVYLNHNGPLSWRQRAWAAVLACWPAALDGDSARRAHEGPGRIYADDSGPSHIMIAHGRKVRAPTGVRLRRVRRFAELAQMNLSPPRMRYDHAILTIADQTTNDMSAIAVLADACGGRRTTAARLMSALESTPRLSRRRWVSQILDDVAQGTCSVLEHGYLDLVERPHGLPRGLRQVEARDSVGRRMFRDVTYGGSRPRWRQHVELDGRLDHSRVADRERDLDRDLDAAVNLEDSVRLGYGQVFRRGCHTANRLDLLFARRGWTGAGHPCPQCPPGLTWRCTPTEEELGSS